MVAQGILVVNEVGMGNGVLELPFALALTQRFARIVHIHSPFLELLVGARALGAAWEFFPASWGIDAQRLGCELRQLISTSGVTHLLSFRNEDDGNEWNNCFAALRDDLRSSGIEVWNLPDQDTGSGSFIQLRWTRMFKAEGVTPDWARARQIIHSLVSAKTLGVEGRTVALCTGGSRVDKCLLPELWADVVRALKTMCPALKVRLIHGLGPSERELGTDLEARIGVVDGGVSVATTVEELANELAYASAVVSNDSFPMHLAYALGRPTLGLFSCTQRAVWGPPDSARFRGLTSAACSSCARMPLQGTCWAQQRCPSPPNAAWDTDVVTDELLDLMNGWEG